MKNILILIGCAKCIFQATKGISQGNKVHKMLTQCEKKEETLQPGFA